MQGEGPGPQGEGPGLTVHVALVLILNEGITTGFSSLLVINDVDLKETQQQQHDSVHE